MEKTGGCFVLLMFLKSYHMLSIYYVPDKSPLMLISVLQVEKRNLERLRVSFMITQLKSGRPGLGIQKPVL